MAPVPGVASQHPLVPSILLLPQPCSWGQPRRVHGNVRLSWLLFASANLKNALVFPFGLGRPQQLPFMPIELGTEAVGAGARCSLACTLIGFISLFPRVSVTSHLNFSFSSKFPETVEINVLSFGHFNHLSFL